MRIEDDIVLDKDDILLRVHPKIPLGGMEGLLPGDLAVKLLKEDVAVDGRKEAKMRGFPDLVRHFSTSKYANFFLF